MGKNRFIVLPVYTHEQQLQKQRSKYTTRAGVSAWVSYKQSLHQGFLQMNK